MNLFKSLRQKIQNIAQKDIYITTIPDVKEEEVNIGGKAIIVDPYFEYSSSNAGIKLKQSRISNTLLRITSQRDWLVSCILRSRCDSISLFANYSNDPLKPSYHFIRKDGQNITPEDEKEFLIMASYLENVGFTNNIPFYDKQNLQEFFKQIVRDILIYGYCCVEKVYTRDGSIHRFRARSADSFYLIDNKMSKEQIDNIIQQSNNKTINRLKYSQENEEVVLLKNNTYKYCQISNDNTILAVFDDEDLIWKNFGYQSGIDSVGYPISHLEEALKLITTHLNVETYNEKIFTNGYASKGILHLKGQVNQEQLIQFRRQFHESISGSDNNWRTPIVAGMDDIQFVSLAPASKDMEYISYNRTIALNLCSVFAINPEEIGLDALSGQTSSPSSSENTEFKIEHSRERGIKPILQFLEDLLNNDIIATINKNFASKYKLEFFLSDDSPASFAALLQAEMTTNSTYNDILRKSGKKIIDHPIADIPLCQNFWQVIEKNLTRGEIREIFLGDKGASKNPCLQYIPGDPMFLQWQQFQHQLKQYEDQKQKEQEQMEFAKQQQQQQYEQQQQQQQQQNYQE